MRILIDASTIEQSMSGIGWYAYSLIKELMALNEVQLGLSVILNSGTHSNIDKMPIDLKRVAYVNRFRRLLPVEPSCLRAFDADLYHETNYVPLPYKGKAIVTICDMSYRLHPHHHPWHRPLYLRLFQNRMTRADRIITISHNSKQEIMDILKIPEERISVTYLGAAERFRPVEVQEEKQKVLRARYGLPEQYILYVGTIEPRKNLERLVKAFYQFHNENPVSNIKLVLAGGLGWKYEGIFEQIKRLHLADRIICTGYVDEQDLPNLYNLALLFVYPSIYEGFGLPPLEAMSCGVPVISSNTSSIPEVVGDAGILVDPYSVNDLAKAMTMVVESSTLRETMASQGLQQASRFSWHQCALDTLKAYENCIRV